ncbi:ABC transporter ATP-binding protein/permease [Anaerofustis stercorihominis]|uniref:ABC transporter, ATP-binding protein n=2 Tax=Anaerofustis stercorihominis TaxID=214853 RepID=B1C6Q9_9FIRM|nr:ABC transporter ATP-binding protein [Anaerofustis stercorihominis]EDS72696.1 ABC transporter, ATP-binding protein [Anaerofustis stercorihominis DSM 17244]MCQ4794070.1 ABC transporter ATP-binding protein/permease [Anaerofustis stercorihominis]
MSIFKKFINYYKPYKKLFYFDMFCAIIVSIVDLAFPQILKYLTNGLFTKGTSVIVKYIGIVAILMFVMYIIRTYCEYFITSWGHIMGANMESNMRQDLFDQYQRLSFSYYDQNNTGDMMSKLVSDLFDISELAHHGPENIFISTFKIVGSFIFLAFISVPLTMILVVITIAMLVFCLILNRKMQATFTDNRKKIAGVNSAVQDSLSGIRVVKSFANEDIEHEKFDYSNRMFLNSKTAQYKMMGKYHAGTSFFKGLLYLAIIVCGGLFVAYGKMNVADLAVYALYIGIFITPVEVLINFTEQFQKGYAGFKRFLDVIELNPDIVDKNEADELKNVGGNIDFNNVSFSYEEGSKVLSNINIHIKKGKTVALVGPSGGGKTTLCSLIPRFYDVDKGDILIDGQNIKDVTLKSLRNSIGVVQQDVYMFGGSIKDNIAYGKPGATDEEIIEAAKNANIHDFIMELEDGYDTYVGERGTRLSGGQKQRISIARVFLKNPEILILDEATSALDNESERHIQLSLEKLSKDRTTIVIAHRLSTIKNADEIIVIVNGRTTERGNHKDLIAKNGLYAKYYNMQFEGLEKFDIYED